MNVTFLTVAMDTGENIRYCAFNKLFVKNVPHILEKIFFSLDYNTFKTCAEVSNTWKDLLSSESYKKASEEMLENKKKKERQLWHASYWGNTEEVRRLLSGGMLDGNGVGFDPWKWKMTPLHMAALHGHLDVVKILLDVGTEPNMADVFGQTPLYLARHSGHKEVVKILLDGGADNNGESPFRKTSCSIL